MSEKRPMQLLVVGVGGQGVLTAAQVLARAAHSVGHPVAVGQLHGMSQRGGSVECTVRLGDVHTSYLVGDTADVVLGFEPLETLRHHFSPHHVVELTLLVGATLMLNRYATALDLPVAEAHAARLREAGLA